MDIIYESAKNFINLENTQYRFCVSQKRKIKEIVLDFLSTDFRHASGLHYVDDIAIEKDPSKIIDEILSTTNPTIADSILDKSQKYKKSQLHVGSVQQRVSDMRYLEKCLDSSDFIRIFKMKAGSQIQADYYIETKCHEINSNVYIFIRKRIESDNYVIVSFFRKLTTFEGDKAYWMLKQKITGGIVKELYRHASYTE